MVMWLRRQKRKLEGTCDKLHMENESLRRGGRGAVAGSGASGGGVSTHTIQHQQQQQHQHMQVCLRSYVDWSWLQSLVRTARAPKSSPRPITQPF
jgi:hypothetical protein